MGLLSGLIKAAIDIATLPLDAIQDVSNVVEGKEPDAIQNKVKETIDDLLNG